MARIAVVVHGRTHARRATSLSANAVTAVLAEMHVEVDEHDLHGWRVGNLRLQRTSGIGDPGGYFVHEVRGPRVRSRVVYTKAGVRELCRDYFKRRADRRGC